MEWAVTTGRLRHIDACESHGGQHHIYDSVEHA